LEQTKKIKEELEEVINNEGVIKSDTKYLSTGCTLLNVLLSGRYDGGIPTGTIINPVGGTHSGKTLLALTMLAIAANDPQFDDYELHMQDTENGDLFNDIEYFGEKFCKRIKKRIDNSMEGFFTHLTEMTDKGKKFIYVIDSYDGLMCAEDRRRKEEIQKSHNEGKEFKYQDFPRRAAFSGEICRNMASAIAETGSIIINISQAKEKLNATPYEDKRRRSGGTALEFYTHAVFWLSVGAKDKETEGTVTINKGHWVNFDITKNRINGQNAKMKLYVRPHYGIDDVVSSIEFLNSIDALVKEKRSFVIEEWGFKGTQDSLIQFIETENKEVELGKMVEKEWNKLIDKHMNKIPRKKRFN
jgi:RecA/RadA recombinase